MNSIFTTAINLASQAGVRLSLLWLPVIVMLDSLLFFVEIFLKKIFNSVVGVFFLFLKLPMTRRVQVCRLGILYNTGLGCHRGSETGEGGFKFRYVPCFLLLFRYSITRSCFSATKVGVFSKKVQGFLINGLFSQKLPLFAT